ncbi:TadE/TadG family type IV pilus assembly protein [Castellaniella sp.]|uniref:TadE/TadG family type IV pilus assembly protein n=1 Tax=Castellaniella sp. TaxID=1955812 RepID=UPI002B001D34|nr:TadE/TadG family type IV pilus assembly protein [Castellaniella sp.]
MNRIRISARRLWRNQKGVTALEFAIVAPLIFIVIFLSLEVAVMLIADATLDRAASRVVRQAKVLELNEVKLEDDDCRQWVMNIMEDALSIWTDAKNLHADAKVYKPGIDNSFKDINDPDYKDKIICDLGNAGDMVVFRLGFERPGLTGLISLMGLDFFRFERTVIVQNEP